MLKNENIICISSIDWDFIWQGHQEIMSTFAKNGNRVFFIENTGIRTPGIKDISRIKSRIKNWFKGIKGIRKESENLYLFSPVILPFPYSRIARWINRRLVMMVLNKWMRSFNFRDPVIWNFLPTGLALDLIGHIDKKLVIYYCLDNLKLVCGNVGKIEKYERKVIEKSDLVFVTSDILYKQCKRFTDNIHKFPFTVNIEKFNKTKLNALPDPEDIADIKRPIIGFSGGVRRWIDVDLVAYLAKSNEDLSFVFVGPLQMDVSRLKGLKNIHFLGQKEHKILPLYVNKFDVAIIPYLINDFPQCISPAKLNEYFALGKPVVSTNLVELKKLNENCDNLVYIADTKNEFDAAIRQALKGEPKSLVDKRIEIAQENNWESRIEQMCNLIDEAVKLKKINENLRWKENFITLYRKSRGRFIKLASVVLASYLLLFYTPLVWYAAEPLKIQQNPLKADCIVVFAGGVGESGKAGQGYEERVQYAVELYKKGYAEHMIFSSGYIYALKEPAVMKALAMYLGVPDGDIILEDRSNSTYDNVKFTSDILEKRRWTSILLISSPYHMKRASLVFRKTAPRIKVTYLPTPNSLFYRPGTDEKGNGTIKRINLSQIKGILHEYMAILYYWWKGYV